MSSQIRKRGRAPMRRRRRRRAPKGENPNTRIRRYFTARNGKVYWAWWYGYEGWPIGRSS